MKIIRKNFWRTQCFEKSKELMLLSFAVVAFTGCGQPVRENSQLNLAVTKTEIWTSTGNKIPVCWDTVGWEREKDIIKNAVLRSWQQFANVEFTGWGFCPIGGERKDVRVRIREQGSENGGGGGSARLGLAALSKWEDNNPGVNFSFNPDGSADVGRVEYLAVHEFGHVLGFHHEQDAPGNVEGPGYCTTSGVDPDARAVTGYDRDSVMNYCNRDGNGKGNLTDTDIKGAQAIYGVRIPLVASQNSCSSAPRSGRVTLGAPWNSANSTSIAVFPNDGTKFLPHAQWANQQGGWGDSVKWASGDFDGDGRSDIAAVWNNGGSNTLTVRRSTGSAFIPQHWTVAGGGWMDSTIWVSGDFNGDGKTDLAGIWNNGGLLSIAVFPSDGTKFLYHKQWADRDGGWIASAKFVVGDFNNDGRDDIAAAWNNGGRTTLTVRQSMANDTFSTVHWSVDAGRWSDSTTFVAGDYNGDRRDDIAMMWNDIGLNSVDVAVSSGSSFNAPSTWSARDGGWASSVKWIPGDFDGDGRSDIAAAWNYGGQNTLTVRTSTGSSFLQAHWAVNAGGWMDTTAWCSGSF